MTRKRTTARKRETFTRWDPVNRLRSEEEIALYLEAAMEEAPDDAAFIAAVLGDIARARGILALADKTGLTRAGIYKALGPGGNPSFETVLKIVSALGFKLTVQTAAEPASLKRHSLLAGSQRHAP